jgi:hypothetical protein
MSPKEKADELIGKCYDTFINDEDEHYTGTAWRLSKQCALVTVNEILKLDIRARNSIEPYEYWEQVKTEIEKL